MIGLSESTTKMQDSEQIVPKRPVTLRDVAKKCGFGINVVARVLREDYHYVREETKERILTAAQELGYDPSANHIARRMRMSRLEKPILNRLITFVAQQWCPKSMYFPFLLQGILDELSSNDFELLVSYLHHQLEASIPTSFARGDVDGIIIEGHPEFSSLIHRLRTESPFGNRPVVSVNYLFPDVSCVVSDDFAGGYTAASHLLDKGHKFLMYVDIDTSPHRLRLDGFRQAYINRRLDPDIHLQPLTFENYTTSIALGGEEILQVLKERPEFTGILAAHDHYAVQICQYLREKGLRIPEDISIVGFDDTEALLDMHGQNILTTVRIPLEETGREAARMLIGRLTGELSADQVTVLPITFVERGSTAPLA